MTKHKFSEKEKHGHHIYGVKIVLVLQKGQIS